MCTTQWMGCEGWENITVSKKIRTQHHTPNDAKHTLILLLIVYHFTLATVIVHPVSTLQTKVSSDSFFCEVESKLINNLEAQKIHSIVYTFYYFSSMLM